MALDADLGPAVTVALQALVQVVLDGLLQRPRPKADHVAVIGVSEQLGDTLRAAQRYFDVGLYDRTGHQCGQVKDNLVGCNIDDSLSAKARLRGMKAHLPHSSG